MSAAEEDAVQVMIIVHVRFTAAILASKFVDTAVRASAAVGMQPRRSVCKTLRRFTNPGLTSNTATSCIRTYCEKP